MTADNFKYITRREYEKLISLTNSNPCIRKLYPDDIDRCIKLVQMRQNRMRDDFVPIRKTEKDYTVKAILMLMYNNPGLMIDDILELTTNDLYRLKLTAAVKPDSTFQDPFLIVRANSNSSALIKIPTKTEHALERLISRYTNIIREADGSNLNTGTPLPEGDFYLFSNSGGTRLTVPAWNRILRRYFEKAGIELDKGGSGSLNYRFRHSFAFKELIEIEKERKLCISELARDRVINRLSDKLGAGIGRKVSDSTCYDYIKAYINNRDQIIADLCARYDYKLLPRV